MGSSGIGREDDGVQRGGWGVEGRMRRRNGLSRDDLARGRGF